MFDYNKVYLQLLNDYDAGAVDQIMQIANSLQGFENYHLLYSRYKLYFMEWYYSLYVGSTDPAKAAKENQGCSGCIQKSLTFMSGLIKFIDQKRKANDGATETTD